LDQLLDEWRNLAEAPRCLRRAELEPQRRGVHARLAFQRVQDPQRFLGLPLLQRDFRGKRQSRHREAPRLRLGSGKIRFRRIELAHVDRRARGDQRGQPRRMWQRQRFLRLLLRLAVATLEQRDDRGVELRPRAIFLLQSSPFAHLRGQLYRAHDHAQPEIERSEAADDEDEQQVERELDAVRRRDQQRVAGVEPRRQRGNDRGDGEQQEPEQKAHLDAYELPQILPGIAQETPPSRLVLRRRFLRRRQAFFQGERQRIDPGDRLIEPQRNSRHVDIGHGLQPVHVARERAPQGDELRPVQALQLRVRQLQRGERRRDIARELQLLA